MGISQKRRYKHSGNKMRYVEAWMQERCMRCGKFLTKRQFKYCKQCSDADMKLGIRYQREREHRIKKAKQYYYENEEDINYKRWLKRERHRRIL